MTKEVKVFEITEETLNKAYDDVLQDPVYGSDLEFLRKEFNKIPDNTDVSTVAKKIALVDVTHSTQLNKHTNGLTVEYLANHIAKIQDFDARVKNGDPALVEAVANNGKVNLFSFASKYCQLHNSLVYGGDDYSKYDTVVCRVLPKYAENITEYRMRKTIRNGYDYCGFMEIIDSVLKDVTTENKRMKFDYLMWYYNRNIGKNGGTVIK